jgi:hypothetical protein
VEGRTDDPRFTFPSNTYFSIPGVKDPAVSHPILVQIFFEFEHNGFGFTSETEVNEQLKVPE